MDRARKLDVFSCVFVTGSDRGTATAGAGGIIAVTWAGGGRRRLIVGYVGEAGIEAGVAYALVGGRFAATDPA